MTHVHAHDSRHDGDIDAPGRRDIEPRSGVGVGGDSALVVIWLPIGYNRSMSFTLDGEKFELTREVVLARLREQSPGKVQQYWVEVDGVRWPVKEAISIATGFARTRFQSQQARHWLKSVGFVIGGSAVNAGPIPAPATSTTPPAKFDPAGLERAETRLPRSVRPSRGGRSVSCPSTLRDSPCSRLCPRSPGSTALTLDSMKSRCGLCT